MPKTTTILLTLLALSFGGNMFIGGLWLGNRMQAHSDTTPHLTRHAPAALSAAAGMSPNEISMRRPHAGRMLLGAAFEDLPDELRQQFRQALRANGGKLRRALAAEKTARNAALDALQAEPFDAAALARALSAIRTAEGERRAIAHEATLSLIEKLTPEQRQAMHHKLSQSLLAPHPMQPGHMDFHRKPPMADGDSTVPLPGR